MTTKSKAQRGNELETCKPLQDRLVVRRDEVVGETEGGILLPDTSQSKQQRGTVISAGPGRRDASGKRIPMDVKAGDRVLFGTYAGLEIRDPVVSRSEEDAFLILREDDVLAVIPPAEDDE